VCRGELRGRVPPESPARHLFAEGLENAGLTHAAPTLSAVARDEIRFLEVTVVLYNVADWKMRSEVHESAMHIEDNHDVTVLCHFRPLDPVLFTPRQAH
jgi:hypothetical protein